MSDRPPQDFRKFSLTYEARPWTLNDERSKHFQRRAERTREWRDAFALLAREQDIPRLAYAEISAHPSYRTARSLPDTAACVGAVKAAVDGLVDAGVLVDDGPELVTVVTFFAPCVDREQPDHLRVCVTGPVAA